MSWHSEKWQRRRFKWWESDSLMVNFKYLHTSYGQDHMDDPYPEDLRGRWLMIWVRLFTYPLVIMDAFKQRQFRKLNKIIYVSGAFYCRIKVKPEITPRPPTISISSWIISCHWCLYKEKQQTRLNKSYKTADHCSDVVFGF